MAVVTGLDWATPTPFGAKIKRDGTAIAKPPWVLTNLFGMKIERGFIAVKPVTQVVGSVRATNVNITSNINLTRTGKPSISTSGGGNTEPTTGQIWPR